MRHGVVQATTVVPNQVFVGIPWRVVRPKYERAIDSLRKRFPLSFVIVGRGGGQDAEDLLALIKGKLSSSSYAIFDASGGNANVSLEFGLAEAQEIPRALYLSAHASSQRSSDAAIIADLAGKRQQRYRQQRGLQRLLTQFAGEHPYTLRFERFVTKNFRRSSRGQKKRRRALALKVIHAIDEKQSARRVDVVEGLRADPARYSRDEIDDMILRLHRARLLRSVQGPHSRVTVV